MQYTTLPLPINESIYFDYAPPPTFAGHINKHPFKINITSSNDNDHIVWLDAKFSKSYQPEDLRSKWDFLKPHYRFYDINEQEIKNIKTTDTKIYLRSDGLINTVSGIFIGVTGTAQFYFSDDIYNYDLALANQPYSTIVATLETSSVNFFDSSGSTDLDYTLPNFSNTRASAYQPHIFRFRVPNYVKISENGIRDYINPRWSAVTQPIVFTLNWNNDFGEYFYDGNEVRPISADSNFCHYIPIDGNNLDFGVTYTGAPITFKDPLVMKSRDENNFLASGYLKTSFTVPETTNSNVTLSATVKFNTPKLSAVNFSPKMWISNPNVGLIHVAEYNYPRNQITKDNINFPVAQISNYDVPIIYDTDYEKDNLYTTGYHGIESIAVLPPPYFQAWATDREQNYIYKFSTIGKIICSIDVNQILRDNGLSFFVNNQCSPNAITIDGDLSFWVTLYDTTSCLKFNRYGEFLFAIDPTKDINYTVPPNIDNQWYFDNEPHPSVGIETQNFVEPTYIDTDSNNDIWLSLSNYASGYLMKYDGYTGESLLTYQYPVCSCPQQIIVDNQDHVWVAMSKNSWNSLGYIEKRKTNGNLISSFGPIKGLNKITIDIEQNIWFTHSYSRIGNIKTIDGVITNLNILDYISDTSKYAPYIMTEPDDNTSETAIEGIATDARGFVYVINSIENRIFVFNSRTKQFIETFYINPQGFNFYPSLTAFGDAETNIEYNRWAKSAQASGDWTGMKWVSKYGSITQYFLTSNDYDFILTDNGDRIINSPDLFYSDVYGDDIEVKGEIKTNSSNTLEFHTNRPEIYKINENFNLKDQMKSVSFIPSLNDSEFLFENLLGSIFGNTNHEDLGVSAYEKISNFVLNNSDLDTCEIDKLYNLASSIDENTNDYKLNYPPLIKKLMNLLSINQSRLWGSTSKNQDNFGKSSSEGILNRGKLLTNTYEVSAGTPVVLKTVSLNKYNIIPTGAINGSNYYNLQSLVNFIGINSDNWNYYYEFYEFIPKTSQIYENNIIDWENENTTLNPNISSYGSWVGNEKMIDLMFSYEMSKGLGLFRNS
jgi:hypothetical protein